MDESEIDIEPIGNGIAIHLPHRKLGSAKKAGWVPVAMGAVGTLFLIGWIATPVSWGVDLIRQGQMFGWLLVAFGSLGFGGLYATLKFLSLGVAVVRDKTRCSIIVTDDKIVSREKFGWFSFKRKLQRDKVEQLFITPVSFDGDSSEERSSQTPSGFIESVFGVDTSDFYAISNQKRNGKMMAPAYSREILEATATAIAGELNRNESGTVLIVRDSVPSASESADRNKSVTVQTVTEEEVEQSSFSLPDDSTIEIVEEGESTVYRIPERTLLKGSKGLFPLSIFWNGFLLIFTMAMFWGNKPDLEMIAFVGFFWLIGIGMVAGAFYLARQSALIGVKDGLLFIERKTIIGTKWTEFSADEVKSIEMAKTNFEVNEVPVMNLKIEPHEGLSATMFSQLGNGELQWLAQQLRRSLAIDSKEDNGLSVKNFDPAIAAKSAPQTDIEVQQESNRTEISVPPWKFEGSAMLWLIGLLFMVVPIPAVIAGILFAGADLILIVFSAVATSFGAAMFFFHKFVTTRNYFISATADRLEVDVRGFWASGGLSVLSSDVQSVKVVDSKTKLNNRQLYCVRIKVAGQNPLIMMTGRREEELVHVAGLIHQRLGLDQQDSDS